MRRQTLDIKKIVSIAMFAALSYAVTFVFHIKVDFLTFDAKDAVLVMCGFIYGPIAALAASLIPATIELITISSTGFWGFLMNFASSAAFSVTAALIYKFKRSLNGAIIGLYSSVAVTTAVMLLLNVLVTPVYMGVPRDVVIDLIPSLLLPFNFAKALMNAAIAMLIYKPISVALKRARIIEGKINTEFNIKSVIMLIVGAFTLAAAIVIFVILKTK